MKPRKWVLAPAVVLLGISTFLFLGLRALEQNKTIERLIMKRVSIVLGTDLHIEHAHIGFFSLYLEHVRFDLPLQSVAVSVGELKMTFSLFQLVNTHGDLARSISKIILINPRIDIASKPRISQEHTETILRDGRGFHIQDLPVERITISKGTMNFINNSFDTINLGRDLSGSIAETSEEVGFDLKGKLASKSHNAFFSGALSKTGSRHHLSFRLHQAKLQDILKDSTCTLTSGFLDGVGEISFFDTAIVPTFESSGGFSITGGSCRMSGIAVPFSKIHAVATLSGTSCKLDSLTCSIGHTEIQGSGTWNFAPDGPGHVSIDARHIDCAQLFPALPVSQISTNGDQGWLHIEARKDSAVNKMSGTLYGGGLSVFGSQVSALGVHAQYNHSQITLDSVHVHNSNVALNAHGVFNFEKSPMVYEIIFDGRIDSFPKQPDIHGTMMINGSVNGLGNKPFLSATCTAKNISYGTIALGSPEISIRSDGASVAIGSTGDNSSYFSMSGRCDSLFTPSASVNITARFGDSALVPFIKQAANIIRDTVDSVEVTCNVYGKIPEVTINADAQIRSGLVHGGVTLSGQNNKDRGLIWNIRSSGLMVNDTIFPLYTSGNISGTTLRIDTLFVLGSASGNAVIDVGRIGSVSGEIAMRNISLNACNKWFTGGALPVQSGTLSGAVRLGGTLERPVITSQLHIACSLSGFSGLMTDVAIAFRDSNLSVLPFVIRQDGRIIASIDSIVPGRSKSGQFFEVDIAPMLAKALPEEYAVQGVLSGSFISDQDTSVVVFASAPSVKLDRWQLDSLLATFTFGSSGLTIDSIQCNDKTRSHVFAYGFVPYSFFGDMPVDADTLQFSFRARGDLLKSVQENFDVPIGGIGPGEIAFAFKATSGSFTITRGNMTIPRGKLVVNRFVPDTIRDFSLKVETDENSNVNLRAHGTINRKPIDITSSHTIPEGYEPLTFGMLDLGVLYVTTTKGGVDIYLPGFMMPKKFGNFEFAPKEKAPFPAFTLSGPFGRLKITGTWILRDMEFTFPRYNTTSTFSFDPFPYISWELDLKPGNRNVCYYKDPIAGKKVSVGRVVEAYLDQPQSKISLVGRDGDKTFRIHGAIRSYRGAVYLPNKTFNLDFEVGLDFLPFYISPERGWNYYPLIYYNAEAPSDSNRYDRDRISMKQRRVEDLASFMPDFSSDAYKAEGQAERDYLVSMYQQMKTVEGAAQVIGNIGEQYLTRSLVNRVQPYARKLGIDELRLESDFAKNYFSGLSNSNSFTMIEQWNKLASSKLNVTMGRYLNDKIFLKGNAAFGIGDSLLHPQYSVGLEYQPLKFLFLEGNYGVRWDQDWQMQNDPQIMFRLRLPIKKNPFDF